MQHFLVHIIDMPSFTSTLLLPLHITSLSWERIKQRVEADEVVQDGERYHKQSGDNKADRDLSNKKERVRVMPSLWLGPYGKGGLSSASIAIQKNILQCQQYRGLLLPQVAAGRNRA